MATYQSYLNKYNSGINGYNKRMDNPYAYSLGRPDKDLVNTMYKNMMTPPVSPDVDENRSFLDRTFDALLLPNYAIAGFFDGMADGSGEGTRNPFQGFWEGLKAGNPFGDGFREGETTFSDVLHSSGWQPEGGLGKFAKGTVGLGLDIVLDPTTYLTGGVSALVKGTGRAGKATEALGKLSSDVAQASAYNSRYTDLVAKGVNPDLAKRVADKSDYSKLVGDIPEVTHMTDDMAKEIINFRNLQSGTAIKPEQLASDATRFADEYNRLIGIRDAKGAGSITWGIGNLPFAPKSWQDKVFRLGSDEGVRKFSDKVGLSGMYAGLRDNIYGRQVGKLFSTTSEMYKLAHEEPAKLWEALEHVITTQGATLDKLQAEKEIRTFIKSMDFTPAQNKEIIELLEDKKAFTAIKARVDISNTEKGKEIRNLMKNRNKQAKQQLDEMLEKREIARVWDEALGREITGEKQFLNEMSEQFRNDLMNFDASSVREIQDVQNLIRTYSTELQTLNKAVTPVRALQSLHKASLAERKAFSDHMKKKTDYETSKLLTSETKESVNMGKLTDKADTAVSRTASRELEQGLSRYIFGSDNGLTRLSDSSADKLMKMVDEGWTPSELYIYIEKNPDLFSPHMRDVNEFIAKELGYKTWHGDGFREPLIKLLGKESDSIKEVKTHELFNEAGELFRANKLSAKGNREFMLLLERHLKRDVMRKEFYRMGEEKFTKLRTDKANREMFEDLELFENSFYNPKAMKSSRTTDTARNREKFVTNEVQGEKGHTMGDRITSMDIGTVINDLIDLKVFTADAIENANPTFIRYISSIIDEVDTLSARRFDKGYLDMSDRQKHVILNMAIKNVSTNNKTLPLEQAKELLAKADENLKAFVNRTKQENPKLGDLTPEEIYSHSVVSKTDVGRKQELADEIAKAHETMKQMKSVSENKYADMKRMYDNFLKEQKDEIIKLEVKQEEFKHWLRETSDEHLEKLRSEIDAIENTLKSNDALESWMRAKSQADVELLRDPQRYTRNVTRTDELPKDWLASAGKDGIKIRSTIDKNKFFTSILTRVRDLHGNRYTKDDIFNMIDSQEKMERFLLEHELSHVANKDHLKTNRAGDMTDPLTVEIERRADEDAFNMLQKFDVDDILREAGFVDSGKLFLDDMASSEKVATAVRALRSKFMAMGAKEVEIGKLGREQFEHHMLDYLPHIPTADGEAFFRSQREFTKGQPKVTHDMGYGLTWSAHSKSRTIKGKNVFEINKYFQDEFPELLKGKNVFSENIADIYLARANKHTELMYDDKYMRTMMDVFGKDIPRSGAIEKGYKAVMNYGMMKQTTNDLASMRLSMHITRDVSDYLSSIMPQLSSMGANTDSQIKKIIDQFFKENYPDETINKLWTDYHGSALKETHMPSKILSDEAMPMVELNEQQINALRDVWDSTYDDYVKTLKSSQAKAVKRGDIERLKELDKRFDKLNRFTPPQIKQVNDVIVADANRARKLQMAKDKSEFLQIYDKFLHFMKLNQTVVLPAFHTRNKVGNVFNNWLVTGTDALNKDWQMATTMLARHRGDAGEIQNLMNKSSKWKDRFRPINIENPHPSLVEALDLTSGQLNWTDVYELALQHGVIDSGQFAKDIGAGAGSYGLFNKLRKTLKSGKTISLDPTDTHNFAGYKAGTEVGTVVENSDRIIGFASALKQGKSIDEASQLSKRALFDYSDLTAFEQSVMKRIFPYYTWLRKNARLQTSQLIESPGKYRDIAKFITGIEHMNDKEDRLNPAFISEWAEDWVQLPFTVRAVSAKHGEDGKVVSEEKRKPVLLSPNLPFMDINRIPDPSNIDESLRSLVSQMSPQIKNPVEMGMNHSMFFNSPLASDSESKPLEYVKYLLSQLGLVGAVSGFGKDNPTDVGLHGLNTATGLKMSGYDYDRSRAMKYKEMEEGVDRAPIDSALERALRRLKGE